MSAASIDRYLKPVKAKDQIKGKSDHQAVAVAALVGQDPQGHR